MKSAAVGTTSGCVIWLMAFGMVLLCLCPLSAAIGGVSATLGANSVASLLGPYLCPENSTAGIVTFQTTVPNDLGGESRATGYEMQCVAADGTVVREGSPDYAVYWVGLLALVSLVVSGGVAFLVAAPLGALIARRSGRSQAARTL